MKTRLPCALAGALTGLALVLVFDGHLHYSAAPVATGPSDISRGLWPVAERIRPSVVRVKALALAEDGQPAGEGWLERLTERLRRRYRPVYTIRAVGSGVALNKRGHIATSHHVIAGADRVVVDVYGNEASRDAEVIGSDPTTDLALVKVSPGRDLVPAVLGDSDALAPGQWVAAAGFPFGLESSFSVGVISALQRSGADVAGHEDFIQTDARIFPGASGGPLCDLRGRVIGVTTTAFTAGTGIGFAVPSAAVVRVIRDLVRYGEARRGYLGLQVGPVTRELAEAFHAGPDQKGALVVETRSGSPAQKAGLARGDIIITYNGTPVPGPDAFKKFVRHTGAGERAKMDILREGERKTVTIMAGQFHYR